MSVDFSHKKIIMIHGLASKPAPEITHRLWRHALTELDARAEQPPRRVRRVGSSRPSQPRLMP